MDIIFKLILAGCALVIFAIALVSRLNKLKRFREQEKEAVRLPADVVSVREKSGTKPKRAIVTYTFTDPEGQTHTARYETFLRVTLPKRGSSVEILYHPEYWPDGIAPGTYDYDKKMLWATVIGFIAIMVSLLFF